MVTVSEVSSEYCLISLLFASDQLPHPADIFSLADAHPTFSITHDLRLDGEPMQALELLVSGLTFDCRWPDAISSLTVPEALGHYDVSPDLPTNALRPLHLLTGTHLPGGQVALPMAQEALALAALFSILPGFVAAVWRPARTWIGAAYLRSIAANWAEGGIFPARGLIGLITMADGAIQSHGMAFFTRQEIRIEAELLGDPDIADRILARLVDRIVGAPRIEGATEFMGPAGRMLRVAPSANGRILRVWGG